MSRAAQIVLAGADERDLTKLAEYEAVGGYEALAKARALAPERRDRRAASPRSCAAAAARSSRRAASGASSRSRTRTRTRTTSSSTPTSRSPGSFKDNEILARVPHRFIEGCLITAHAVESKSVYVYIRGEYLEPVRDPRRRARGDPRPPDDPRRRHDRRPPRRGRLHLRRGDGAARLARGQARPAAHEAAVPRRRRASTPRRRSSTTSRRSRPSRRSCAMGGAEYAKLGVENSRGTRLVSVSGHVERAGNYEIEPGVITLRDLIYADDLGGGIPGGHALKAVIPGGSSTVILTGDEIDVGYDFDSLLKLEHGDGLGRRDRARRARLHGAARHPRLGVLRARVVRQVHAVPRGDALDDDDPAQARGGRRVRATSSTCCSRSATGSTASASARSATPRRWRSRATSTSSATSSSRTSTAAAARSTTRRSTASSRRSRSTRTPTLRASRRTA